MLYLRKLLVTQQGGTSVEYALILALIAGVCLFAIMVVGLLAGGFWSDSANSLEFHLEDAAARQRK